MKKLTFKEESCLVGNQVASKILRRIHQAGDNCPSQIGSLDKIEESRPTTQLFFNSDRSLNHSECPGGVFFLLSKTPKGAESFFLAPSADQPPRRLGGEEDDDQKGGLKM